MKTVVIFLLFPLFGKRHFIRVLERKNALCVWWIKKRKLKPLYAAVNVISSMFSWKF